MMEEWMLTLTISMTVMTLVILILTIVVWRVAQNTLKVTKDALEVAEKNLGLFIKPDVRFSDKPLNHRPILIPEQSATNIQLFNECPLPITVELENFNVEIVPDLSFENANDVIELTITDFHDYKSKHGIVRALPYALEHNIDLGFRFVAKGDVSSEPQKVVVKASVPFHYGGEKHIIDHNYTYEVSGSR